MQLTIFDAIADSRASSSCGKTSPASSACATTPSDVFSEPLPGRMCRSNRQGGGWTDAGYVLGPRRTIAWRILDAQYFGVAQRRARVFVIASPVDGPDPRDILFEREGVRRDSAPRRPK